jgi:integrase/recombinase XerD
MARRLPNFLTPSEIEAIAAAAQAEVEAARTDGARARAVRDQVALAMGLLLGLRVSEIAKMRVEHVDLAQRQVLVAQGKGAKDRYVPIPERLAPVLAAAIAGRTSGFLLASAAGQRVGIRTLQLRINRLGQLAGVNRRVKAHTLRHSYATALLSKGATLPEIQQLLGHNSLATTQVYLHCDTSRLKGAVDRL